MHKDLEVTILNLEKYQRYCEQLLSIFSNHSKNNPKELDAIEGAIVFLIERFNSVVHSLPPLIEIYYNRRSVTAHSIYSILRSFSLDAMQLSEYIKVLGDSQGKDEDAIRKELNEIASRHFCDKIWGLVFKLDQDPEDINTILSEFPYCFEKSENGKIQKAYNNRQQPSQVEKEMETNQVEKEKKSLKVYYRNLLNLYNALSKVEHFQIIGFGIIRSPELFESRVPKIVANEMKMHIGYLCFIHECAFEKYDISTPILDELGMKENKCNRN